VFVFCGLVCVCVCVCACVCVCKATFDGLFKLVSSVCVIELGSREGNIDRLRQIGTAELAINLHTVRAQTTHLSIVAA
jgi:hypothetical protein